MVFSYFGSKSRVVQHYSPPKYKTIVEPFAGSARYACRYGTDKGARHRRLGLVRDVWINDANPVIYHIWKWIQEASLKDVENLPELEYGQDLRNVSGLSTAERLLLRFTVGCSANPSNTVTFWASGEGGIQTPRITRLKERLRNIVGRIDHWKITNLDYTKVVKSNKCTWFIDAPYQCARSRYKVDPRSPKFFRDLKSYCLKRRGQTIVCEGQGADWLPFEILTTQSVLATQLASKSTQYTELVWERNN